MRRAAKEVAVRPVVKPALRRVWRDATTLQIGVHQARSVVVGGITAKTAQLVAAFDGAHDAEALRRTARQLGLEASTVDRLLDLLGDAAVLDDASSDVGELATLPRSTSVIGSRPISLRSRWCRAAPTADSRRSLGARRRQSASSARAGSAAPSRPSWRPPALAIWWSTTRRRAVHPTAAPLAHRSPTPAAPVRRRLTPRSTAPAHSTRTTQLLGTQRYDIVVLAAATSLDPAVSDQLVRTDVPHINVIVREATAVVGPLVLPGSTACLRCLELHRCDRDPALATDRRAARLRRSACRRRCLRRRTGHVGGECVRAAGAGLCRRRHTRSMRRHAGNRPAGLANPASKLAAAPGLRLLLGRPRNRGPGY